MGNSTSKNENVTSKPNEKSKSTTNSSNLVEDKKQKLLTRRSFKQSITKQFNSLKSLKENKRAKINWKNLH